MSRERQIRLAPSLLAADFSDLRGALRMLDGLVDLFHVDVMDGHFVPNLTMGPMVVEALRPLTEATLDVHLMVSEPDRWIGPYRDAGADWISVHYEVCNHLERTLSCIRDAGARAGLVLNPASYPTGLEYVLSEEDYVLIMSVNPGFGGQTFLPSSLAKAESLRALLDEQGLSSVELEIDGGVDVDNAADCVRAGVDVLVAGSSVYRADDPRDAARRLLERARAAV